MANSPRTTKTSTTAKKTTTRSAGKTTAKTATSKTTRAKAATATKATAKPSALAATKASASTANAGAAATEGAEIFRRADLLERVAALTGQRKNKIRETVDATLTALGEALVQERDAAVKPLGRISVIRVDKKDDDTIIRAKIKYQPGEDAGKSDTKGDVNEDDDDDQDDDDD